jgi:PRTRC genetic system ThiF family protein
MWWDEDHPGDNPYAYYYSDSNDVTTYALNLWPYPEEEIQIMAGTPRATVTPAEPVVPEVMADTYFMDALNAKKLSRTRNFQHLYQLYFRVIGCGGTGSKLIPELAQALALYLESGTQVNRSCNVDLVLCDPDIVEVGNLNRQHFPPSDVGKNKARALADRYSAAYGLTIGWRDEFIDTSEDLSSFVWQETLNGYPPSNSIYFLITAVDNHATRKIIHQWFDQGRHRTYSYRPFFWIDIANEETNGYVTVGFLNSDEYNFALPIVTEVFPEILKEAGELRPSELPCGAAGIQDLNINAAAATHCMSVIRALLKKLSVRGEDGRNDTYNFDNVLNYYQIEFGVSPPTTRVKHNLWKNLMHIKPIMEGTSNRRHFNVEAT